MVLFETIAVAFAMFSERERRSRDSRKNRA